MEGKCKYCGVTMLSGSFKECDACYQNLLDTTDAPAEQKVVGDHIEFSEQINQPDYYNWHPSGIACVDISEHFPGNIAQAVQYIYRAGRKPGEPAEKDYSKAVWFLLREIQRLKKLEMK
jgi:hypothetical protein